MPATLPPADEFAFARALDPMVAHMDSSIASRALRLARAVRDPGARARALAVLSHAVAEEERPAVLEEALAAAHGIGDPWRRVRALTAVALRLPANARAPIAREAFEATLTIHGDWLRGRALGLLASFASGKVRTLTIEAALALSSPNVRASALSTFAGELPIDELERLLAHVEVIPDEWLRQTLLVSLAQHLPRPALERAVDLARRLHGMPRALALAELDRALPHWEPALREEGLAEARGLDQPSERAEALTGLLAGMPEESRVRPAGEALAAARAVGDPAVRAALLADLIEFLPGGRVSEVVVEAGLAAREIIDPVLRAERLSGLIPYLRDAERSAAIREVLTPFEG